MADAKKAAAAAAVAGAEAPKGGKSKLMLITIMAVVLGGGAGAYFAFGGKQPEQAKPAVGAPVVKAAPLYYKFDPAFIVNFSGDDGTRYLQVAMEAMTRDAKVSAAIKENEPAIRNDMLLLLSGQKLETLNTAEGKEELRKQALATIAKVVTAEGYDGKLIEGVYFTSFVIQ
ncbi:MAG: flagellar basal body-associated FliL family protein [Steroidobacteraceae bacterium]